MSFINCYEKVEANELEFLIEFLFQLTIYGREIHSYDSNDKQLTALSQLNEINHRVLNRVRDLASTAPSTDKGCLARMVAHHVKLGKGIERGIDHAANQAFVALTISSAGD